MEEEGGDSGADSDGFSDEGSVGGADVPGMVRVDREGGWVEVDAEGMGLSAEDEADLARFLPSASRERKTLADIIMERIREKEEGAAAMGSGSGGRGGGGSGDAMDELAASMDPKVVEVYTDVGRFLSGYRSGKLPKVFKLIPSLRDWEQVVYMTDPDSWSPAAVRAATRIFASNLNPKMAQRFYNLVLLPRVRDDIADNKHLNYHLYMSLKKALYKPAAFYKGVLLPLCESGDCSLREAAIIGSVLAKVSIPQVHSAACLLKLASMPYSAATAVFMRVVLNKKYSLPYRVVDALVEHFASFTSDPQRLPVIWHQTLLTFCQRYKHDVTREQKEALRALLKAHTHHMITPEVRRELFSSASRGERAAGEGGMGMMGGAGGGAHVSDAGMA